MPIQKKIRILVSERAGHCCEYCRSREDLAYVERFSVEHIEPQSRKGTHELDNLALSCQGCNNHKYVKTHGRDPAVPEIVPLFHPRRQRWRDHFAWSEDGTLIIGLTPTGRATVVAMRLNRAGLVKLRRILFDAGEHPPPETE